MFVSARGIDSASVLIVLHMFDFFIFDLDYVPPNAEVLHKEVCRDLLTEVDKLVQLEGGSEFLASHQLKHLEGLNKPFHYLARLSMNSSGYAAYRLLKLFESVDPVFRTFEPNTFDKFFTVIFKNLFLRLNHVPLAMMYGDYFVIQSMKLLLPYLQFISQSGHKSGKQFVRDHVAEPMVDVIVSIIKNHPTEVKNELYFIHNLVKFLNGCAISDLYNEHSPKYWRLCDKIYSLVGLPLPPTATNHAMLAIVGEVITGGDLPDIIHLASPEEQEIFGKIEQNWVTKQLDLIKTVEDARQVRAWIQATGNNPHNRLFNHLDSLFRGQAETSSGSSQSPVKPIRRLPFKKK